MTIFSCSVVEPFEEIMRTKRFVQERARSKHQTPNTKHQRNTKPQAPKGGLVALGVWCLELLWCLVFGARCLDPFNLINLFNLLTYLTQLTLHRRLTCNHLFEVF